MTRGREIKTVMKNEREKEMGRKLERERERETEREKDKVANFSTDPAVLFRRKEFVQFSFLIETVLHPISPKFSFPRQQKLATNAFLN